jgi:hypothetical protein
MATVDSQIKSPATTISENTTELAGNRKLVWQNVIKQDDSKDRIYMIHKTTKTLDDSKLHPTELAKIKSATRHFEAIGIDDYARAVAGKWGL